MAARLDAVRPLLTALLAEPPAAIAIQGASATAPFVWQGVPGVACFHVPPSANVAAKRLARYTGDGSAGAYYANVLGAASGPLPAAATACVGLTASRGLPPSRYTLALEDSATGQGFAACPLTVERAGLTITAASLAGASTLVVTLRWSAPRGRTTAADTIRAVDARSAAVAWVYTRTLSRALPARGAAPAAAGLALIRLSKAAARGGAPSSS
jgi:hypothetical protein